jgi:esterase/lipase superfamily enzyme
MSLLKSCIAAVFLLVLLSGCSSRTRLMPTPHLYTIGGKQLFEELPPELKTNQVDLMYFTDRLPEKNEAGNLNYGYGRSPSAAYGSARVELGDKLSWEKLVAISTSKTDSSSRPTLEVVSVNEFGRFPATPYLYRVVGKNDTLELDPDVIAERKQIMAQGRNELVRRLALTSSNEVFVFIHGINYTFDESVKVVAGGHHFFGREGVWIAYSWPAGSRGIFNYAYDRESGEFTIFHLKNFLKFLASVQEVEKIHLISHSRGTDVLMTALRELWLELRATDRDPGKKFRIGNVVLIAPDLDFGVTMQRVVAEGLGAFYERMTIYSNANDEAISAAKILFGSWLRVGAVRQDMLSDQQRQTSRQLTNLDIISYQGSSGGRFGHSYFLSNPAVSSDLLALLRYGWAPGKENGRPLENLDGGNVWRINDAYPLYTQ